MLKVISFLGAIYSVYAIDVPQENPTDFQNQEIVCVSKNDSFENHSHHASSSQQIAPQQQEWKVLAQSYVVTPFYKFLSFSQEKAKDLLSFSKKTLQKTTHLFQNIFKSKKVETIKK